jgi:hypothetical protein
MEEVKPGTDIYIIDDIINDELCQTLKIVIDHTPGEYTNEYSHVSNVKAKNISPLLHIENKKFGKVIDNEIYNIMKEIIKKIGEKLSHMGPIGSDEGYTLRKIHGATQLHIDDIIPNDFPQYSVKDLRKVSVIIALNSDYDGGEFVFPRQDVKVKLKKGQAIVFPPFWTHQHKTNDLENDTFRYTINTWLHY